MNETAQNTEIAMKTRYWGGNLPEDCIDWLKSNALRTADTQTEIVKRLIRKAMEDQQSAQTAN